MFCYVFIVDDVDDIAVLRVANAPLCMSTYANVLLLSMVPFARMARNAWVVWPVAKMKMKFKSWRFFVRAVVSRIFQNSKFCASHRTQAHTMNVCAYEFFGSLVTHCGIWMPVYMQDHPKRLASQTGDAPAQAGMGFGISGFVDCKLQIASPCAVCNMV